MGQGVLLTLFLFLFLHLHLAFGAEYEFHFYPTKYVQKSEVLLPKYKEKLELALQNAPDLDHTHTHLLKITGKQENYILVNAPEGIPGPVLADLTSEYKPSGGDVPLVFRLKLGMDDGTARARPAMKGDAELTLEKGESVIGLVSKDGASFTAKQANKLSFEHSGTNDEGVAVIGMVDADLNNLMGSRFPAKKNGGKKVAFVYDDDGAPTRVVGEVAMGGKSSRATGEHAPVHVEDSSEKPKPMAAQEESKESHEEEKQPVLTRNQLRRQQEYRARERKRLAKLADATPPPSETPSVSNSGGPLGK